MSGSEASCTQVCIRVLSTVQTDEEQIRSSSWRIFALHPRRLSSAKSLALQVIPEYYRGSIECIDRNVVREPVDW